MAMEDLTRKHGIIGINDLEKRILADIEVAGSLLFEYQRKNRPENSLGEHIAHQLVFINHLGFNEEINGKLRVISLLHDYGKCKVKRTWKGDVDGLTHAEISAEFAKKYIQDPEILKIIRWHDKYYSFYLKFKKRSKFDILDFTRIFSSINLDLMVRFNYVDSCDREKDAIIWFEDKCCDIGLSKAKIYSLYPKVLDFYIDIINERDCA